MKLYATVSSERATKGQGGNKKLTISLLHDNKKREEVLRLIVLPAGDKDPLPIVAVDYATYEIAQMLGEYATEYANKLLEEAKGKRRKGEPSPEDGGCIYNHDHGGGGCEYHN